MKIVYEYVKNYYFYKFFKINLQIIMSIDKFKLIQTDYIYMTFLLL
jgi:hypothetical protein